jgi:uncharacterized protein (TIGR03437 family)
LAELEWRDDASVSFDGVPVPLQGSLAAGIRVIVPAALAGRLRTTLAVAWGGAPVAEADVPLTSSAPGLFCMWDGRGQAAALNASGRVNGTDHPARAGDIVSLFGTGEGMEPGPLSAGVGGIGAEVLYAGAAPGLPGVFQVNLRVPAGVKPGSAPVVVMFGEAATQSGVTIEVE